MKKTLIISDLDGTISNSSLVLSHCGYLIENNVIVDDGSFQAWQDDKKNESLIISVAQNYRNGIKGLHKDDLLVSEFIKDFTEQDNFYTQVLKEFELISKVIPTDILLVTGSSDFLVKELVTYLKYWLETDSITFKASQYITDSNGYLTGDIVGMFSETQKDNYISDMQLRDTYDFILGYGDTSSDNGIFKHCTHNTLVAPTKQTKDFFRNSETVITSVIYS